jgi:hypothetical protein
MVTENKETNGHELQATKKNGVLRIEHKENKNEWIESNAYCSKSRMR